MQIKFYAFIGTAMTLAMVGTSGLAQAESPDAKIPLSPAAQQILCERSPLNSRCSQQGTPNISQQQTLPPATSSSEAAPASPTAPTSEAAPASPTVPGTSEATPASPAAPLENTEALPQPAANPDASPSNPTSNAPEEPAPASNAPDAEGASPSTSDPASNPGAAEPIPPEELQKFAKTFSLLKVIQQDAQKEMAEIIQQEGLSQERFEMLFQAQQEPNPQSQPQVSAEEEQKFAQANSKINQVQQGSEAKMRQVIQQQGLNPQRFEEILAAVQKDPALQQQVQQLMQP